MRFTHKIGELPDTISYLGLELDRGSLMNIGCYLGALGILGLNATPEEIIEYLRGEISEDMALQKISRSRITLNGSW